MKAGEFYNELGNYMSKNPGLRKGQALFNVVFEHDPKLAYDVVGTPNDPYYDNKYINKFISFLFNEGFLT